MPPSPRLSEPRLERRRRVGPVVPVLDHDRRLNGQPLIAAHVEVIGRVPGTTTAPGWNLERPGRDGAVHGLAHQVVHGRPPRQDRRPHRAPHSLRTIAPSYTPQFPPMTTSLSMITGRRVDRLQDAADLYPGAHMHSLANLGTRSDERRASRSSCRRLDVRPDVDVGRRHAHDAVREYAPRRIVVPPATTRTSSVTAKLRGTRVSLSKNENGPTSMRPMASRGDWSTSVPTRKAARIPRLTHETADHRPSAARSAARTTPCSRASRSASMVADAAGSARPTLPGAASAVASASTRSRRPPTPGSARCVTGVPSPGECSGTHQAVANRGEMSLGERNQRQPVRRAHLPDADAARPWPGADWIPRMRLASTA